MTMPYVTSEVISSVRIQSERSKGDKLYCLDILKEMRDENPNLAEAIHASLNLICERHGLDDSNLDDLSLKVNIFNLVASVYSAIKQQMIVNELESA